MLQFSRDLSKIQAPFKSDLFIDIIGIKQTKRWNKEDCEIGFVVGVSSKQETPESCDVLLKCSKQLSHDFIIFSPCEHVWSWRLTLLLMVPKYWLTSLLNFFFIGRNNFLAAVQLTVLGLVTCNILSYFACVWGELWKDDGGSFNSLVRT